jgi:hypothetical protein
MSEQIKVGDLVVVVRWPHSCQGNKFLGSVFRIGALSSSVQCPRCGEIFKTPVAHPEEKSRAIPLAWLKRIPPLSELETEKTNEPATA